MTQNPFAPKFDELPGSIPVFPLGSVLLLPHGQLPLNIFEPRYIQMIDDALASHKMIGMIQPKDDADKPALSALGCAGKIIDYSETADGRYHITLSGISRFRVAEEISATTLYRQIRAQWDDFSGDVVSQGCLDLDRDKLSAMLKDYFAMEGLSCDWSRIDQSSDQKLITALSMICPFDSKEKQALLEACDCHKRADLFLQMLEMNLKCKTASEGSSGKTH